MRYYKIQSPVLHIPDDLKEELSRGIGPGKCVIIDQIVSDQADEYQTQLIYTCVWFAGEYLFFQELKTDSGTFYRSHVLTENAPDAADIWNKTHETKFPAPDQLEQRSWTEFVASKAA